MLSRNSLRIRQLSFKTMTHYRSPKLISPMIRSYSSEPEKQGKDLMEVLKSNEKVMETLENFGKFMQEKGFDGSLGVMKQMKFLTDPEVRSELKKVGQEMKAAGVKLKPEDIQAFTDMLNVTKK